MPKLKINPIKMIKTKFNWLKWKQNFITQKFWYLYYCTKQLKKNWTKQKKKKVMLKLAILLTLHLALKAVKTFIFYIMIKLKILNYKFANLF